MNIKQFRALALLVGSGALSVSVAHQACAQASNELNTIVALKLSNTQPEALVQWLSLDDASNSGPNPLALPKGIESLVPNQRTNEIWVRGTQEGIAQLRTLVILLDQPQKQVKIQAEFVEVDAVEAAKLLAEPGKDQVTPVGDPQDGVNDNLLVLAKARPNFRTVLNTLFTARRARVLTSSQVTTLNNSTVQVSLNANAISQVLGLEATPTVNNDGTISLSLQIQASGQKVMVVAHTAATETLAVRLSQIKGDAKSQRLILAFLTANEIQG